MQPRFIAALRQRQGAAVSTTPSVDSVDPATITDRDGTAAMGIAGTNLDHGTATITDNEVGVGAITCDNVSVNSSTDVSFDYTVTDGVTTIGVHTLTFTNDNGSDTFQVTVTDG